MPGISVGAARACRRAATLGRYHSGRFLKPTQGGRDEHSDQHREATPRCYSLIVRTTLEVGRLSLAEPFTCFKIASS